MRRSILVVVVIVALGCSGSRSGTTSEASSAESAAPVVDGGSAQPAETVTIIGEAQNAKLGAVVLKDGSPTYVSGLDRWPDDVIGKTVKVKGTIRTTDAFKAEQDENGAWSQGTGGAITIIHEPRWEIAD